MKIFKRISKIFFIIIVVYFIIALLTTIGYRQKANPNALPHYYQRGVYHMHTQFSDGSGTVGELVRVANKQNLNFIIITDHGRPNRKSTAATSWQDNVLIIGASEFSLNCGHMAALGYAEHDYIYGPEAQEAINEVNETAGVTFISHPFDTRTPWTDWDINRFTGIEILSTYSSAKRIGILKLLLFPGQYLFNSNLALLHALDYPRQNLKKWNQINQNGRYYGIFALDAHANIKTPFGSLKYPSYDALFRILRVYVKVDEPLVKDAHKSSHIILEALKKGNFFNAVDALAPANGFENYFIPEGEKKVEMGGFTDSTRGKLILNLPFPFNTNVEVFKDGKLFHQIKNNKQHRIELKISSEGVYRCEIRISDNSFESLPWIVSNPIFIGTPAVPIPKHPDGIKKAIDISSPGFAIERNATSRGHLEYSEDSEGQKIIHFKFKLIKKHDQIDFWSALAMRKTMDFSGYQGIAFQVKSNPRLRFICDIRNKGRSYDAWYFHSLLARRDWQWVFLPFKKFRMIQGDSPAPDLKNISALIITINNFIAFQGTEGHVQIKNLGLY